MICRGFLISALAYSLMANAAIAAADCNNSAEGKLVECLEARLENLESQVKTLQALPTPNLNNIVIEWIDHNGNCMGIMGGNTNVQIFGTCSDPNRNRFRIRGF